MSEDFIPFPKIPRLQRKCIITEKIDGTNSSIHIDETGTLITGVGSRNRWITPGKHTDNYGFAAWVEEHAIQLIAELGPGHHYGEWWGRGIGRGYDQDIRHFSLFHPVRVNGPLVLCKVVPTLFEGEFATWKIDQVMFSLNEHGSAVVKGYPKPEGIIIYHTAANQLFKRTFEHDEGKDK